MLLKYFNFDLLGLLILIQIIAMLITPLITNFVFFYLSLNDPSQPQIIFNEALGAPQLTRQLHDGPWENPSRNNRDATRRGVKIQLGSRLENRSIVIWNRPGKDQTGWTGSRRKPCFGWRRGAFVRWDAWRCAVMGTESLRQVRCHCHSMKIPLRWTWSVFVKTYTESIQL